MADRERVRKVGVGRVWLLRIALKAAGVAAFVFACVAGVLVAVGALAVAGILGVAGVEFESAIVIGSVAAVPLATFVRRFR